MRIFTQVTYKDKGDKIMAFVQSKAVYETGGSFEITHPFKIYLKKSQPQGTSQPTYSVAVSYHSQLLKNTFTKNEGYFSFQKQNITGLDQFQIIPPPESKNVYVVLNCGVSNLTVTSADIDFIQEGQPGLAPITIDPESLDQTFAQVVLGIIVDDAEATPGEISDGQTTYVIQKVFTDLIVTNLVINNIPVIMPVPFGGGPIN